MEMGLIKAGSKAKEQLNKNALSVETSLQELTVKSVLSKELQLYYDQVTESAFSEEEAISLAALESLARDPGLQPLLPYFVQLVTETVYPPSDIIFGMT